MICGTVNNNMASVLILVSFVCRDSSYILSAPERKNIEAFYSGSAIVSPPPVMLLYVSTRVRVFIQITLMPVHVAML